MAERVKLTEMEWSDRFGHHIEIRAVTAAGRIVAQTVTKLPHFGWTGLEEARAAVLRQALKDQETHHE